jgi:hypothetical protein
MDWLQFNHFTKLLTNIHVPSEESFNNALARISSIKSSGEI